MELINNVILVLAGLVALIHVGLLVFGLVGWVWGEWEMRRFRRLDPRELEREP